MATIMKELSIEEKAKLYDEAIERANELSYVSDSDSLQYKTVEHIFPELKESEDERIRKALLEYFAEQCDMSDWNGVYGYQVVAWLEKQGEMGTNGNEREIPNPVWSEEDERLFQIVINILDRENHLGNISRTDLIACVRKLKSLKRYTWKPTEEQIQALEYQVHSTYKGSWQYKATKELLEQLKKL